MSLGIFLMYACLLEALINNSGPFINGRPIPRPYRKLMLSKTHDEAPQRIHTRSVTKGNSEGDSVDLSELNLPTLCSTDRNSDASCKTLLESLAWHKEQQEVRERIAREIRKGKKESDATSLKEECNNGEVDKVTCDQYYEWLKWRKSHIKRVYEQTTGATEGLRQREERSIDEKPRKDILLDEKESSEVYQEEGTDQSTGSKENSNEEDEIVIFKKSCEEGKEDKEICNALLNWLKENVESEVSTQKAKREADHSEIGNKDEEVEKVSELSEKQLEQDETSTNRKSTKGTDIIDKKEGSLRDGNSLPDLKMDCEHGKEDQETCKFYFDWLKSMRNQKKRSGEIEKTTEKVGSQTGEVDIPMEDGYNDDYNEKMPNEHANKEMRNDRKSKKALKDDETNMEQEETGQEEDEDFAKLCEQGKEDKEACESYMLWINWKKTHENSSPEEKLEKRDYQSKNVDKIKDTTRQISKQNEGEDMNKETSSKLLDEEIRADLEKDDAYFHKVSEKHGVAEQEGLRKTSLEKERKGTDALNDLDSRMEDTAENWKAEDENGVSEAHQDENNDGNFGRTIPSEEETST